MVVRQFPPVSYADENGLLAAGGDLEVETLLLAYRSGIFPWPYDESPLLWWAPPKRAVLYVDKLHISRSLLREIKKERFEFRRNDDFESVIKGCAKTKRKGGTWLTKALIKAYCDLYRAGYAYSVEAYHESKLVGGLFGVKIERFVSAESMYYEEPNASKLCLHFLCQELQKAEIAWIDLQVLNTFTKKIGAVELPREKYMQILGRALGRK